jgi:hypothetical protein
VVSDQFRSVLCHFTTNNKVYEYLVSYAVEKKSIILSSHYIITYTFAHAIMSHTVEHGRPYLRKRMLCYVPPSRWQKCYPICARTTEKGRLRTKNY